MATLTGIQPGLESAAADRRVSKSKSRAAGTQRHAKQSNMERTSGDTARVRKRVSTKCRYCLRHTLMRATSQRQSGMNGCMQVVHFRFSGSLRYDGAPFSAEARWLPKSVRPSAVEAVLSSTDGRRSGRRRSDPASQQINLSHPCAPKPPWCSRGQRSHRAASHGGRSRRSWHGSPNWAHLIGCPGPP